MKTFNSIDEILKEAERLLSKPVPPTLDELLSSIKKENGNSINDN